MKASQLRDIDDAALRDHIATARRDLFGLRLQHATGELENTAGLRTAKRELARALTVARQRGMDPTVNTTAERATAERRGGERSETGDDENG